MSTAPHLSRRTFLLSTAALASGARAQGFPSRPVRWVVGYPPGAGTDFLARSVSIGLASQLGQQVIIENKAGASGAIAAEAVAKSAPDGYTILTADNGMLIYNLGLFKKLSYDPRKEFAPIGLMARAPVMLLANPNAGFTNARDLVEAMRKNPGKISYATPGIGTPHNLGMEMLKDKANLSALPIHYRGGAPAIQDVLGNQLGLILLDVASASPLVKSGKLKPIGIFSRNRHPALADVQSFVEVGATDIEAYAWQGLVVPSATPADVRTRLSESLQKALQMPDVAAKVADFGWEIITPNSAADMQKMWDDDAKYWLKLIQDRKISAE